MFDILQVEILSSLDSVQFWDTHATLTKVWSLKAHFILCQWYNFFIKLYCWIKTTVSLLFWMKLLGLKIPVRASGLFTDANRQQFLGQIIIIWQKEYTSFGSWKSEKKSQQQKLSALWLGNFAQKNLSTLRGVRKAATVSIKTSVLFLRTSSSLQSS